MQSKKRKTNRYDIVSVMLTDISTSDETGYSEPVYKHIVNQLAACKELGYHIEIGSDCSGGRQHGLQDTTCDKIQKCCCPRTQLIN